MIRTLAGIEDKVLSAGKRHRIAVAWAQDPNTVQAIHKAVMAGTAEATMIGNPAEIERVCRNASVDIGEFSILSAENESVASELAVRLAREGKADIVMKGLVGTDKFLKAVMDKETGIMIPGAVLSYVAAIELPARDKLLFISDPAVIPHPDLNQKCAMADYAIDMAQRFGIARPKMALIGASEKPGKHFLYSGDYASMCSLAAEGRFGDCIVDGPLDIFLACDRESVEIKGVSTPVNGEADILLFPSLESSNPFYKGLMLFAGGELAGLIRGTTKPVVVMSRSESERSKYYCITLACLMAGG